MASDIPLPSHSHSGAFRRTIPTDRSHSCHPRRPLLSIPIVQLRYRLSRLLHNPYAAHQSRALSESAICWDPSTLPLSATRTSPLITSFRRLFSALQTQIPNCLGFVQAWHENRQVTVHGGMSIFFELLVHLSLPTRIHRLITRPADWPPGRSC
jgi:hypothetical protein